MVQRHKKKLNCWEFMQCGREKGGEKATELGVCPAATDMVLHQVHGGQNCGRACWVMEGTLCAATVQGHFVKKIKKCILCGFFHYVEAQEGKKLKKPSELLQTIQTDKTSKTVCNAPRHHYRQDHGTLEPELRTDNEGQGLGL